MAQIWKRLVADKRRRQLESIPKDWLIQVPDEHIVDVTAVPERCGLLSDRELQITNTEDVNEILDKLAKGEWSAVEVTNAFCKRAIIAHQLVRMSRSCTEDNCDATELLISAGKLPH